MTRNRCLRSLAIGLSLIPLSIAVSAGTANADETIRWKTIIGIIQAGNVVAGIGGGGQPWSTLGGEASLNVTTGKLRFSSVLIISTPTAPVAPTTATCGLRSIKEAGNI